MPCNARLQGLEVKMDTHSARQKSMRSSVMGGLGVKMETHLYD